jgi:spiro-SPASM protein
MINSTAMKLSVCIDATGLSPYAVRPIAGGAPAAARVRAFVDRLAGVHAVTILSEPSTPDGVSDALVTGGGSAAPRVDSRDHWDTAVLMQALKEAAGETEAVLYCRADTPFVDPELTARMIENHYAYVAEYTFADGYPAGMTPEVVDPRILDQLRTLAEKEPAPIGGDGLFAVVQKDINAFDVETELSPVDLRMLRATLACDTRRNYLLCDRLARELEGAAAESPGAGKTAEVSAASPRAERITQLLQTRGELLRTLPAWISVQVVSGEVQQPVHSPYHLIRPDALDTREEMPASRFAGLISEIAEYAPDSMVHISLWGEVGLHSAVSRLIETVEGTAGLELLVETSGVGWNPAALEAVAGMSLSSTRFIVDLDTDDEDSYRRVRGEGFQEARQTTDTLLEAHGNRVYVQTIRMRETEQEVETFYRAWKDRGVNVIVQKYDHYCGRLDDRRVTDISPVTRFPCRHTQRDLNILLDGTVPMCREDLHRDHVMGNVFEDGIDRVWQNGNAAHLRQVRAEYPELCRRCDEYYTFNY